MASTIQSNFIAIRDAIGNTYQQASFGNVGLALKSFNQISASTLNFFGFGAACSKLAYLIARKDLKYTQKIIPFVSYSIFGLISLATSIAACVAASTFFPMLLSLACIMRLSRDVGCYLEDRHERKNLKKIFANKAQIHEEIASCQLPERLEKDFEGFLAQDHFDANKIQEMYVRLSNNFINKHHKKQQALSALLHQENIENLTPQEQQALRDEIEVKENELKELFKEENKALFDLVEKKQRLHYLHKNVKRRLGNVMLQIGITILTLSAAVTFYVLPFTPLVALAPIIYGSYAAAAGGLSTAAAVNGTQISIREYLSQKKAAQPRALVEDAIYPNIRHRAMTQGPAAELARVNILYKSRWQRIKEWFSFGKRAITTTNMALETPKDVVKVEFVNQEIDDKASESLSNNKASPIQSIHSVEEFMKIVIQDEIAHETNVSEGNEPPDAPEIQKPMPDAASHGGRRKVVLRMVEHYEAKHAAKSAHKSNPSTVEKKPRPTRGS